jgi:CelD/BcsL family acetyltransferase involved in cellulose biosynthesis
MMDSISFLGVVGLTLTITMHKRFAPVRALWPDLFACPMCIGFQLGLWTCALWLLRAEPEPLVRIITGFLYGGATSATSYFLYAHYHDMGAP